MRLIASLPLLFMLAQPVWAQDAPAPGPASENAAMNRDENEFIYRVALGRAADVALLLQQGANPNQTNRAGWPAISVAAARNDADALPIVKMLSEAGADVNACDTGHVCPMIAATKAGSVEVVQYLIDIGADVTVKDALGRTPLAIASSYSNSTLKTLLTAATAAQEEELSRKQKPDYVNYLLFQYAYSNCASQYTTYVIDAKMGDEALQERMKRYRQKYTMFIRTQSNELRQLTKIPSATILKVAKASKDTVLRQLDGMLTNRNRLSEGVGTDKDLTRRCTEISTGWKVAPKVEE